MGRCSGAPTVNQAAPDTPGSGGVSGAAVSDPAAPDAASSAVLPGAAASGTRKPQPDYTLYLVTDRDLMAAPDIEALVDGACAGGATCVQLREKHAGREEFTALARRVKRITDAHGVPLIVNDAAEVAAVVGAAGVHVGQDDMPVADARAIVGPDAVVGVSASTLEEARRAQGAGADYLGIGAMRFTPTKPDAHVTGADELRRILAAVQIPCVVIGGVNEETIPAYAGLPLAGFAVVSAIVSDPDPRAAARRLRRAIAAFPS